MPKNSFIIHNDLREKIDCLSEEQIGKLFIAMLDYNIDGTLPNFTSELKVAFCFIKTQLDADNAKYDIKCKHNSENAAIRWNNPTANACERMRTPAKHADTDTDTDTDITDILVNTRISSAEPNPVCSSEIDEKSIIELILNDKSTYSITQSKIDELEPLYPAIDILSELKKMQGWLLGNPKNRKTRSGIMRFVTSWLCRAQDKSKSNTVSNKETSNPFLQIAKDEGIL